MTAHRSYATDPSQYGISRGVASPEEHQEAQRAYQRQHKHKRRLLAWARKHGMSASEAARFLARYRCTKQEAHEAQARLRGHALLWCCGAWHVVHQMPLRVLCCGRVYLAPTKEQAA